MSKGAATGAEEGAEEVEDKQIPECPETVANAQPNCAPFMARYCGGNSSTQTSATLMVFSTRTTFGRCPSPRRTPRSSCSCGGRILAFT